MKRVPLKSFIYYSEYCSDCAYLVPFLNKLSPMRSHKFYHTFVLGRSHSNLGHANENDKLVESGKWSY